MGVVEFAISPWGQQIPIHIRWFLIWVAGIAGLLFLIGHAIWFRYFRKTAHEPAPDPAIAAKVPEKVQRHSLAARMFHWIMARVHVDAAVHGVPAEGRL